MNARSNMEILFTSSKITNYYILLFVRQTVNIEFCLAVFIIAVYYHMIGINLDTHLLLCKT